MKPKSNETQTMPKINLSSPEVCIYGRKPDKETCNVCSAYCPIGHESQREATATYKAADDYAHQWHDNNKETFPEVAKRGFINGVKWDQKQYTLIGVTEIYLEDDGGEPPYIQEWLDLSDQLFKLPKGKFKPGDKVAILLRKIGQ